ncbi:MAG: LysE family translocator [Desulfobacterales bacterium]|nr:LysE family translocator [Desulfobacterales bacterium]
MFVLAASPGPGVFATISRSLASGFWRSLALIAGIVVGDILFLLMAIFGLAVIARVLGDFFLFVRVGGGLYLIWLGWRMWRSDPQIGGINGGRDGRSGWQNFLGGLLLTLGNPKVILFYIGFLPTFMDLTKLAPFDVVLAALVVSSVLASVLATYSFLADRTRRLFSGPVAGRRLNRAAGTVMMGTGAVLASRIAET